MNEKMIDFYDVYRQRNMGIKIKNIKRIFAMNDEDKSERYLPEVQKIYKNLNHDCDQIVVIIEKENNTINEYFLRTTAEYIVDKVNELQR